jgi:hypothetical protein
MGYVVVGWDGIIIPTGWYKRLAVKVMHLCLDFGYRDCSDKRA